MQGLEWSMNLHRYSALTQETQAAWLRLLRAPLRQLSLPRRSCSRCSSALTREPQGAGTLVDPHAYREETVGATPARYILPTGAQRVSRPQTDRMWTRPTIEET